MNAAAKCQLHISNVTLWVKHVPLDRDVVTVGQDNTVHYSAGRCWHTVVLREGHDTCVGRGISKTRRTSLNHWYKADTRFWRVIWMLQLKLRLILRGNDLQSLIVQFWFFADRTDTWLVSDCWSPSCFRYNVCSDGILHSLVVTSGYYYSLFSFKPVCSFSSKIAHHQSIFVHTTWRTILCKPWRWLCMKITVDQQFLKYSKLPICYRQPC